MFNPVRLELARKRRQLTAKTLAQRAGISPVTLSRIVNGVQAPDPDTISGLAAALDYPTGFFELDDGDLLSEESASFRSLTAITARERDAALSAATLAFSVADWVSVRFHLPEPDLLDLAHERDPASGARSLRQHWQIGEKPIGNIIALLEAKGIRVFSLAEQNKNVDAFSCWRSEEPYIFLNTLKSAERSRFDAAHELGHLVLHKHGGTQRDRSVEMEANAFASAFLMPEADVVSHAPRYGSVSNIVVAKRRWGVAAVALAYRLHKLGLITEWQYIQVNRQYRTSEPDPLPAEHSSVWQMVLAEIWKDGVTKTHLAQQLSLPHDEVESLLFGLAGFASTPERTSAPNLRTV